MVCNFDGRCLDCTIHVDLCTRPDAGPPADTGVTSDLGPAGDSAWMDADLFTGGVADLLSSEADSLQAEAVLIGFEPVSIAEKSVLIGKGEGSGTGITVRVRFDRVSECILTGTKTVEQIWRTVGWVKPDRIPHDKKAVLFIRDIGNASRKIKARRKDDVERTTPEIDEQAREEYRQRVANA